MKRVLSGIQPTGAIHIGNYLGAVKHWVASQDAFENLFCLVDLHAITIRQEPKVLKEKTREVARILLAAGIDPERSTLFVQSDVPTHCELAWMLSCICNMGRMERMTQFKEKSERLKGQASVGLFTYPALMAADILIYQADLVPVGDDQKQHLELTRDLAEIFNRDYGETFTLPEPSIPKVGARIMGLDDPTRKMSKSIDDPGHSVLVLDEPKRILKKFKRAKTDSGTEIRFDPDRPGVHNLLTIYQAFTHEDPAAIEARFAGKGYGDLKQAVADAVIEGLRPLQERYRELLEQPAHVDEVLARGAEKARALAAETIGLVKERLGLG